MMIAPLFPADRFPDYQRLGREGLPFFDIETTGLAGGTGTYVEPNVWVRHPV